MSWFVYQITNSKLAARRRRRHRIRADDVVLDLGRLAGRSSIRNARSSSRRRAAQMICAFLLAAGVWAGFADAVVHHRRRCAQRRRHGLRHAGAPGVHSRNDKPRRFAKRDLAQQLDRERRARRRSIGRWLDDRRGWRGDVFFPERPDLCRGDRRFVDDASCRLSSGKRDRFYQASTPGTASCIQ